MLICPHCEKRVPGFIQFSDNAVATVTMAASSVNSLAMGYPSITVLPVNIATQLHDLTLCAAGVPPPPCVQDQEPA